MFKVCTNYHPTISSPPCQFFLLSSTKSTHIRTSHSVPFSLIYWPEMFSIFVIHWPTTHLCFSTHQRLIHSNKRKFTYPSPIGYLPMFTLIDAILEILLYKLRIYKSTPVSSSLFQCPLTHPLSNSYQPNHTLFHNNK